MGMGSERKPPATSMSNKSLSESQPNPHDAFTNEEIAQIHRCDQQRLESPVAALFGDQSGKSHHFHDENYDREEGQHSLSALPVIHRQSHVPTPRM